MIADLTVHGAGARIERDAVVRVHTSVMDGHGDAKSGVEGLFGRFVFDELDLDGTVNTRVECRRSLDLMGRLNVHPRTGLCL